MSGLTRSSFTVNALTGISAARRTIAQQLGDLGLDALRIEDVTIAASELITNALQHAGPPAEVELSVADGSILLTVTDHTGGQPAIPAVDPTRIGGNGLRIVEALTDEWGSTAVDGNGKQVWFRIDR